MLFNVYDQNNQVVGQVEGNTTNEAWHYARRMYEMEDRIVLDVREAENIEVPMGEPKVYKVDNIDVTIQYIRPGVHEVSFLLPDKTSEETLLKIDNLIKEVTGIKD